MSDAYSLKPFASRGEVFYVSGKLELLPVQLFCLPSGEVVFRVGLTTFCFDSEGQYLGTECRVPSAAPLAPYPKKLDQLRASAQEGRWQLPDTAYFERGSPEHECERSSDTGSPKDKVETTTPVHNS